MEKDPKGKESGVANTPITSGGANNGKGNKSWKNNQRYKNKGKGRNNAQGKNGSIKEDSSAIDKSYRPNDPSWYAKTDQLIKDAASLSFNNAIGARFDLTETHDVANKGAWDIAYPGIACLLTCTVPGIATDASAPLNVAARNIYSYVRHANSGHSNYDSPDLMLYLLAMDQLYSMYSWMTRTYGIMRSYSQKNRYLADGLVTALGFNFTDFQANLANFRYYLNQFALKLSALYTPSTMDLYKRHTFIYSGVWKDSDTDKCQLYVTKPTGFHQFDATIEPTGGSLQFKGLSGTMTYAQLVAYATPFLDAVLSDEDMNIMSGDIRKAYGDKLYSLKLIPEDYVVVPTYDPVFLDQIHNAVVTNDALIASMAVKQSATVDYLVFDPTLKYEGNNGANYDPYSYRRVLTLEKDVVEPVDVMEATRLMCARWCDLAPATPVIHMISSGADFITNVSIWKYRRNTVSGAWECTPNIGVMSGERYTNSATSAADLGVFMSELADYEKFHNHPSVRHFYWPVATPADVVMMGEFLEIANYTLIDNSTISKMNETALLSLFGVPQP